MIMLLQGCGNAVCKTAKEYNCFVKTLESSIVASEEDVCRITVDYLNCEKMIYHESVLVKDENNDEKEILFYYIYDLKTNERTKLDFVPAHESDVWIAPNNLLIWDIGWTDEFVVTREDGKFINSVDIYDILYRKGMQEQEQSSYGRWTTRNLCCDENYIYIYGWFFGDDDCKDSLCILDWKLNLVEHKEVISGGVIEKTNGEVIFVSETETNVEIYKYDENKKGLKKEKNSRADSWDLIPLSDKESVSGDDKYERYFLLRPGQMLDYPADFLGVRKEKTYSIFSYETMGIDYSMIKYIVSDQQGGFLLALQGNDKKKVELITLQPTNQEMNYAIKNGKKIITVGVADYWLDASSIASSYNMESDEYYVEVKNYTQEYSDYNEAITHLNLDIISGNACDAYFLNHLDINSYKEKGVLLELSDYFKHRKEAGLEDFTDTFYRLVKDEEGNAFYIFPCYKLMGLSAKEKIDYNNMDVISRNLCENMAFSNSEATEIFSRLLRFSGTRYIDVQKKQSHIQEKEFASLLKLLMLQNEYNHAVGNQIERYSNGEIYSVDVQIAYPQWFFYYEKYLGNNFTASYPGGEDLCVDPMTYMIGVSKNCENPEAIYQFLDFLYTPAIYNWYFCYEGFPVLESIWQEWNKSLLATEPYYDSQGYYIQPYDITLGTGENAIVIKSGSLSQNDFDRMRKKAEQAVFIQPMPEKYIDIILSEVTPFLEGNASLEDTIKAMDYRVSLALEE